MVGLNPLATGLLEGTLLALLGIILFHLRHRAGLIPYVFLLGGLALTVPVTAHLTTISLPEPWTISRAYAIVLPVFIALVLLLHILVGSLEARITATLPALGGALVGAAALASRAFPVVIPHELLPSVPTALVGGALVGVGAIAAMELFAWWHRHVARAALLVFVVACLAGVLVHGLAHEALRTAGLALPGGVWPAIVAVPLVAGLAPVAFVGVYADVLLGDLEPVAPARSEEDPSGDGEGLERYRDAATRFHQALAWIQEAHEDQAQRSVDGGRFVATPDGRVLHATEPAAWMLGTTAEELAGRNLASLFEEPGLARNGQARDPEALLKEGRHRVRLRGRNGGARTLEIDVDRTEQGALRGRIHDRTPEAYRREAERERRRARLALDVLARDLPNALAAPRTRSERLAELAAKGELGEREARLARELDRGLGDLGEALDRTRVLREVEQTPSSTIDALDELEAAVQGLSPEVLERMRVRWRTPSDAVQAEASPLIRTAFAEILENVAVHAGPDATVTIAVDRRRDRWTVRFDDDGPGIPNELKERIFEGFRRGSDGPGSGIGLALARAIIQAYGGRLWVEDRVPGQPSEGASFQVELPAAEPSTVRRSAAVEPTGTKGADRARA